MKRIVLVILACMGSISLFASTYYVDASRPFSGDGTSWATAKKLIQDAIFLTFPGDTIVVTNGTYVGGQYGIGGVIDTGNAAITITSVNGPSVTFLDGENTRRCAKLGTYTGVPITNTVMVGFTLCNGNAPVSDNSGGGSLGGTLYNCIFTNNAARVGGGACAGVLYNCILVGNSGDSGGGALCTLNNCEVLANSGDSAGGVNSCTLNSCLIANNTSSADSLIHGAGGAWFCTLNNCTISRNSGNGSGPNSGGVGYSSMTNCIVWGNRGGAGVVNNYNANCTFRQSCTTPSPGGNNISLDPLFVDNANGDFHLSVGSPCVDAGANALVSGTTDLEGNTRIIDGNGDGVPIVDMGAYEASTGFQIAANFDSQGGTVNPTSKLVSSGSPYGTLPMPIRTNYSFGGWWTGTGGTGTNVTETNIVSTVLNHTLYASWTGNPFSIIVVSDQGGANPGTITTSFGTVVTQWITNSPVANGATQYVCVGATVTGSVFTVVNPTNITLTLTNNCSLSWMWQSQYWLNTSTSGNGSVTPSGWYASGTYAVLTATPESHWHFAGVIGDTNGCILNGNVIRVPIQQALNVVANFALDQEVLTVISVQGGASPGSISVEYGADVLQWVTNSPATFGATQYLCSGATVTGNDYTQINSTNVTLTLTNTATLTWNWQAQQYLLTTGTNGRGGVTPGDWYVCGSNVVLIATPGANAHHIGWLGDTNGCVIAGNTLTAPMTQARSITALFAVDTKTLTVTSAHGGAVPGSTTVNWGAPVSEWVTNSPVNLGTAQYVCTGASVSGNSFTQVSPTNVSLTLTNNATLTWRWTTNYWLGTVTTGAGSVSVPSGWQNAGNFVTIIATPAATSHFVQWSGNTNGCLIASNCLTAAMTQARNITAVFAAGALPVIFGRITRSDTKAAMAGVTISFSGVAGTAISDTNGNYSMVIPYGWAGTATASFTNGGFAKPALTFKKITKNQTKKNFVWSPDPVISGTVTRSDTKVGLAGVTITGNNNGGVTTTDGSGNYSLTVPYKWTGVVTPSMAGGGTFKKPSVSYSNLTKSKAKQKFVWTPLVPAIVSQAVSDNQSLLLSHGFTQWAIDHGLVGNPADLFDQINSDGISYGAQYTFGANLLKGEPLVRLLTNNGILTAEIPLQYPSTLLDAHELVEFTADPTTGFWFPAVCLPPQASTPATKQWFQAGHGEAVDFRVKVELVK